jgi:acetaldehyde dehydrogenase/alcohol dehydrogenase
MIEERQKKVGLANPEIKPEIKPDIAIVDPQFAITMSPETTAQTGMDTLTHAIEGLTCTRKNSY